MNLKNYIKSKNLENVEVNASDKKELVININGYNEETGEAEFKKSIILDDISDFDYEIKRKESKILTLQNNIISIQNEIESLNDEILDIEEAKKDCEKIING